MAGRIWKTSQAWTALLAGAAMAALPTLAQAQEQERGRIDHDIADNSGREREDGPRPFSTRNWRDAGEGPAQRDRAAPPPSAPAQPAWQRPAPGWTPPAPRASVPPPVEPARERVFSTDNRAGAVPQPQGRQQGWDGQRWNGQNWDRGNPAPRGDARPRQWDGDRRADGQARGDGDRRWNGGGNPGGQWNGNRGGNGDRSWNGDRGWNGNRGWDRDPSWDRNRAPSWSNRRESWSSRSDRDWDRQWRQDRRYDWRGWRSDHRDVYRMNRYLPPYRSYVYRRLGIGFYLDNGFFGANYWINDPWMYRLPPAYGPYRWVRYYDDAVMVNIYSGEVVDVIYDFFW